MGGKFLPLLAMVVVQFGYAGMNILSRVAMNSGMNPFINVAYRQIFTTLCIVPFAYFLERVTVNQITYIVGLKNSTPTITCALSNINPAEKIVFAGSVLIVLGLYGVLWGKNRETMAVHNIDLNEEITAQNEETKNDLEINMVNLTRLLQNRAFKCGKWKPYMERRGAALNKICPLSSSKSISFLDFLITYIQSTCATSGEGLYEGLDWLSNNIANKLAATYCNCELGRAALGPDRQGHQFNKGHDRLQFFNVPGST
ncbi:WAT1-related protein [Forsythia ovata]|uniref:WAT1-related protein n=1 Tax=Forsythia ovata TaxID=205694 RepID=A0ABD1PXM8_9LAMI